MKTSSNVDLLTYCPWSFNGKGPGLTCISILENIPSSTLNKTLYLPRKTRRIHNSIVVKHTIPFPFNYLPWKYISRHAAPSLNNSFAKAIQTARPETSIAYFWPDPPRSLVELARGRGLITVREMINTFQGSAKIILDKAYDKLGLVPQHGITEESVERERLELSTYDYVFASNSLVEASLIEANIKPEKILRSSFGWSPSRLGRSSSAKQERATFTALFVGTISVRKGVPQLLDAWKQSGVDGELILAGGVEEALKPLLEKYSGQSVRFLDYVPDVGQLYHSADVFVFPTLEEGGPQVSYEAAGCGLPVITTPMGAGRIIKDGVNGLIVEANDVSGLAKSLSQIASSKDLRSRLARQATLDAERYAYEKIGLERSMILRDLIDRHRRKR